MCWAPWSGQWRVKLTMVTGSCVGLRGEDSGASKLTMVTAAHEPVHLGGGTRQLVQRCCTDSSVGAFDFLSLCEALGVSPLCL